MERKFSFRKYISSIRAALALVPHLKLELHPMDVVTAFLNGEIEEDIYM